MRFFTANLDINGTGETCHMISPGFLGLMAYSSVVYIGNASKEVVAAPDHDSGSGGGRNRCENPVSA